MPHSRRTFLTLAGAGLVSPTVLRVAGSSSVTPEEFGARGDGVTNDTAAFARLSAEVNRRGGGTILLRAQRTYVVGAQITGRGNFSWAPEPIIDLKDLTGPVHILGNGARLKAAPGLRFGAFDPASGEPVQREAHNYRRSELASPYLAMIAIQRCHAPVEVRDVELDGNNAQLRIGGRYGDKGWQVPATGLLLRGNRDAETVVNVFTHHHGTDGAMLVGLMDRFGRSRIARLVSRYNGRQGLSITGGRGYDFTDCEFSHTGRGVLHSAPGAGLDIEAENKRLIRDLTFTRCAFVDNTGAGMVADSGDSADAHFIDCRFVGTTNWSAWPNKPGFAFDRCTFVGSVVHAWPDADPRRAGHFAHCRFTDDPKLSPTGQVYTANGPIVNLGASDNVLFDGCTFDLVGSGVLPWSSKAIYRDCQMRQRSPKKAMTKGRYLGSTTITGPVDLSGSMIEGSLIVNGHAVPRGPV